MQSTTDEKSADAETSAAAESSAAEAEESSAVEQASAVQNSATGEEFSAVEPPATTDFAEENVDGNESARMEEKAESDVNAGKEAETAAASAGPEVNEALQDMRSTDSEFSDPPVVASETSDGEKVGKYGDGPSVQMEEKSSCGDDHRMDEDKNVIGVVGDKTTAAAVSVGDQVTASSDPAPVNSGSSKCNKKDDDNDVTCVDDDLTCAMDDVEKSGKSEAEKSASGGVGNNESSKSSIAKMTDEGLQIDISDDDVIGDVEATPKEKQDASSTVVTSKSSVPTEKSSSSVDQDKRTPPKSDAAKPSTTLKTSSPRTAPRASQSNNGRQDSKKAGDGGDDENESDVVIVSDNESDRGGKSDNNQAISDNDSDDDVVIEDDSDDDEGAKKRGWRAERNSARHGAGDRNPSSIDAYASKMTDLRDRLNRRRGGGGAAGRGRESKSPSGQAAAGGREASRSSSIEIISVCCRTR